MFEAFGESFFNRRLISGLTMNGPVCSSALRSAWLHFTQLLPAWHCVIFQPTNLRITKWKLRSRIKNCTCWCGTCHYDAEYNSRSASAAKMWNHRVPHGRESVVFYGTKYLERTIHCMPRGWSHEVEMKKVRTTSQSIRSRSNVGTPEISPFVSFG